jgi:hypothetical protein
LVKAQNYKSEGRGLDFRWCHWNFLLILSFWPHYGAGVVSASNIISGIFPWGKGGRCVGLTTLPPPCADGLKIWESQPPGTLGACTGIAVPKDFWTAWYIGTADSLPYDTVNRQLNFGPNNNKHSSLTGAVVFPSPLKTNINLNFI